MENPGKNDPLLFHLFDCCVGVGQRLVKWVPGIILLSSNQKLWSVLNWNWNWIGFGIELDLELNDASPMTVGLNQSISTFKIFSFSLKFPPQTFYLPAMFCFISIRLHSRFPSTNHMQSFVIRSDGWLVVQTTNNIVEVCCCYNDGRLTASAFTLIFVIQKNKTRNYDRRAVIQVKVNNNKKIYETKQSNKMMDILQSSQVVLPISWPILIKKSLKKNNRNFDRFFAMKTILK